MLDNVLTKRPKGYFAIHFYLLRFLGLGWWHDSESGDYSNFPGWYLYYSILAMVIWVAGFVGLESIDPFIGEKDIDRFMFSLSFVITHDLTIIKLYIFIFKNRAIQDIVRTLEINMHDYYQNHEKIRATIKISRIMTSSFLFFGWITIGNANVYGTIQDLKWKAEVAQLNDSSSVPIRTLPQPIYIPWKYQSDASYISTFALETVGLLWTGHIVMSIDTFIGSLILHMSSQFEILQEAFITLYERALSQQLTDIPRNVNTDENSTMTIKSGDNILTDSLDKLENKVKSFYSQKQIETAIEKSLLNCIYQHQLLISCVEKFRMTYSYGFMTQLLSSMAAICVVMVQVSKDASSFKSVRLVTSLAFFVAMLIQLALQCFTANELTFQAGAVSVAVMHAHWERMTPRARRLLLLVMMRAQRPLRLTAAGFAYMDNGCFLASRREEKDDSGGLTGIREKAGEESPTEKADVRLNLEVK